MVRHTPFWGIPFLYIGLQFGYIYWVKEFRKISFAFLALGGLAFVSLCYYMVAGGPDHSVELIQQTLENWF